MCFGDPSDWGPRKSYEKHHSNQERQSIRMPTFTEPASSPPLPIHLSPPSQFSSDLDAFATASIPLPSLIAFDLDFTLWPFYLCRTFGAPFSPVENSTDQHHHLKDSGGRKIAVADDVFGILLWLARLKAARPDLKLEIAIASRSERPDWCAEVFSKLRLFPRHLVVSISKNSDQPVGHYQISDLIDAKLMQIIPRMSKKIHFTNLRKASRIPFQNHLFYDDEVSNVKEVGKLGVTSVLVPRNSTNAALTWEIFVRGLKEYAKMKGSSSVLKSWLVRVPTERKDAETPKGQFYMEEESGKGGTKRKIEEVGYDSSQKAGFWKFQQRAGEQVGPDLN